MKSFADWTQELAESVGEVKHHWEDEAIEPRWQAQNGPDTMNDSIEDPFGQPNWPIGAAPSQPGPGMPTPPPAPVPTSGDPGLAPRVNCQCDNFCDGAKHDCYMYSPWYGAPNNYRLCDSCHTNHFPAWKRV